MQSSFPRLLHSYSKNIIIHVCFNPSDKYYTLRFYPLCVWGRGRGEGGFHPNLPSFYPKICNCSAIVTASGGSYPQTPIVTISHTLLHCMFFIESFRMPHIL